MNLFLLRWLHSSKYFIPAWVALIPDSDPVQARRSNLQDPRGTNTDSHGREVMRSGFGLATWRFNLLTRCIRPYRMLKEFLIKYRGYVFGILKKRFNLNILDVKDTLYVKVKFAKIQEMTNKWKHLTMVYWLWSAKAWVSNGICNPNSPRPDLWRLD
jgi:hypothetical protein